MIIGIEDLVVLNIDRLYGCLISAHYELVKVQKLKKFLWWTFNSSETEKKPYWKIEISYTRVDGKEYTWHHSNWDKQPLEKMLKSLVKQLKQADAELVSAALEAAIFGEIA